MKVALFSDQTGGVYVYSHRLTKQLIQLGAHVDFITHPPRDDIGAARLFSLKEDRVTLRLVPRNKEEVSQEQTQQLYQAFLASEADIIIPNYRAISYAAVAQLSRERKTRVLGICHDHSRIVYQFLKYYEPIINGFICPASKTHHRLQEILPHRRQDIRHIAHGVPVVDGAGPSYEGGEIRLVYHGRLEEEQKSVSSLIHLAERLAKGGIEFKLLLVGDGPDRQSYLDRAKANGLGDRILFLGHLEGAALDQVLGESHVAVLTSRHEGFCLSLAEAMGVGLPGLAFDCGGVINDYLVNGDSGFILPWGDLDGMSKRVRRFSDRPSEWKRMSLNARQRMSEGFSLQRFGERTKEFMAELIVRDERREWPKSGKSIFYTESRLASLGRSLISRIRGSKAGEAR